MNKKFIFFSILLTISALFMLHALNTQPERISSVPQVNGVREISFSPQETAVPPIQVPTVVIPSIVINPTPSSTGFSGLITPLTILVFVLVGAIILIALIAVSRKPSS